MVAPPAVRFFLCFFEGELVGSTRCPRLLLRAARLILAAICAKQVREEIWIFGLWRIFFVLNLYLGVRTWGVHFFLKAESGNSLRHFSQAILSGNSLR